MLEKVYLYLLILGAILSQVIFGTFLEDGIGESSNILDRKKRVISRISGEDVPVEQGDVPYLVNIKKNRRLHCLGTILSRYTVITAARCVPLHQKYYEIFAGSIFTYNGASRNVTNIAMHGHSPSRSPTFLTGIALLTVTPPFRYRSTVSYIKLHEEPVLTGVSGTISGWGNYVYGGKSESSCAHKLRSITVPIMNQQECRNIYRGHFPITEEDFCTYHPQKLCGHTDAGAPFVIDNKLVGVHIGTIDTAGRELSIKPDVFVLLQLHEYRQWIDRRIVL